MDLERFAERFPVLYHATFAENAPGILRRGLLCAEDLVRLAGIPTQAADASLSEPRIDAVDLALPGGDTATLRDQIPLRLAHLRRLHPHISATRYCRNLSRRVFFWCLNSKRTAASHPEYRGRVQETLVFDTRKVLQDHADRVELCRINSGTILMPSAVGSEKNRNPETMFSPIGECAWALGEIKEVTIVGSLHDVSRYLSAEGPGIGSDSRRR